MKRYFSSIKQYSWIVLACTLLATVAGLLIARNQPTVYQVSSVMLVQAGAPGTTYPGGPTPGGTSADSLGQALNYASEIPTRVVMQHVIKRYPQLQQRGFTADDLVLDVIPSTSTTAATISLLATATHPADAVLIANDVANGFADYIQVQSLQHLDELRNNLTNQIKALQEQKTNWETQLSRLPNNTVPQYAIDNNNLVDTTHALDTAQQQLNALPVTINGDVSLIQPVTPKDVTASPKGLIITGVTAGVGLFVGILIMLLVIFLDNRLRSDEQVNEKLGMAYLGSLSDNSELKTPTRTSGSVAHELSDICANLRLTGVLPERWHAPQGAVLLITSPRAAEGKSTLAAALAATVALAGSSVVVVDGNLHQPSTHLTFGMSSTTLGLSDLLKGTGNGAVDAAVVRSPTPGVWLLPAGTAMDGSSLLLQQKLPGILKQLCTRTDLVIIDGPALLSGADACQLANMADGVALVVDTRHDKLPLMVRARNLLNSLTHTPTGIIMNRLAGQSGNRYYATAYPGNAPSERWIAVKSFAGNGNYVSHATEPVPEIALPGVPKLPLNVAMMQMNQSTALPAPRGNPPQPSGLGKGE